MYTCLAKVRSGGGVGIAALFFLSCLFFLVCVVCIPSRLDWTPDFSFRIWSFRVGWEEFELDCLCGTWFEGC